MENDHASDWPWLKFEKFSSGVCALYGFVLCTSVLCTI
jgi:hypothetical protein